MKVIPLPTKKKKLLRSLAALKGWETRRRNLKKKRILGLPKKQTRNQPKKQSKSQPKSHSKQKKNVKQVSKKRTPQSKKPVAVLPAKKSNKKNQKPKKKQERKAPPTTKKKPVVKKTTVKKKKRKKKKPLDFKEQKSTQSKQLRKAISTIKKLEKKLNQKKLEIDHIRKVTIPIIPIAVSERDGKRTLAEWMIEEAKRKGKHAEEVFIEIAEASDGTMSPREVYSAMMGSPQLESAAE